MRAIHMSVRVASLRRALSHGDGMGTAPSKVLHYYYALILHRCEVSKHNNSKVLHYYYALILHTCDPSLVLIGLA